MKGKLSLYKDEEAKVPADLNFGEVVAGEAKQLIVYARNDGPTLLRDLKVTSGRDDLEIKNGIKNFLNPKAIWEIILISKPSISMEEQIVRDEVLITGISVPLE